MTSSLEELRARKVARDEARAKAAEALEVEALTLEEKYESELGPRGVVFDVLTTDVGNFVIKRPEFIVAKRFMAADKRGDEEVAAFVGPCIVFPAPEVFRATVLLHGGIAWRLANVALELYEARRAKDAGK